MRPIDADVLKSDIPKTRESAFEDCRECTLLDKEQVQLLIDKQPTLDAVPVVRCKDCKYYKTESGECPANNEDDPYYSWIPKPDWYCAEGKRKEDA